MAMLSAFLLATVVSFSPGASVTQSADSGLILDSLAEAREFGWRSYTVNEDPALLKPDSRYQLSFRCRVTGGGEKAHLLVLVRPWSRWDGERDALSCSVWPQVGVWQKVSLPFETREAQDYRLQFHSWNRIRAEIRDVTIEERPPLVFIPAEASVSTEGARTDDRLPSGAREFDVDLPRSSSQLVLDAADFGVSVTNADNTAALRMAFAAAKAQKAAKLVVAPGEYRLTGDAPLVLNGYHDLTFEAPGVTFVSYRKNGAFLDMNACERIRLIGFTLDWDWSRTPLASLVKVVRTAKDSFDLEFVGYEDFPDKDVALTILSAWDPETRSVGIEDGITRAYDMHRAPDSRVMRTWIDGKTVRVIGPPNGFAVGQLYRLQHFYYHMNGITMNSNAHVRLENITIRSTPGHAFTIHGTQHHTLFSAVRIVAPEDDPRRVITCTADHLHIGSSRGFIKLEACEFSRGADDIMNMHDNTCPARYLSRKTIRAVNAPHYGHLRKGTRVEVRHGDYSPTGFVGTVAEVKPAEGNRTFDITFEEDVPCETKDGFVLFNLDYDTHNVIVRDCYFHNNRARGILVLARDVTIENNVFRHQEMGAIKIETGYTFDCWSEGYGVSNVVIRGNLFERQNPAGEVRSHRERTIYAGVYLKHDPATETTDYPILSDILIEGNTFRDNCGVAAYLSSVHRVTVRNNLLEDPTSRRRNLPYRSQFHLVQAKDVVIRDNVYRRSPYVISPGVVYDPENSRGIVVSGNRVTTE